MNFQYYHRRRYDFLQKLQPTGGNTYFLNTPSRDEILHLFQHSDPVIRMGFGEVECHAQDHYNRRVGREYALSRARTREFRLIDINFRGEKQRFLLQCDDLKKVVILEGQPNSDKLFFRGIL